VRKLELMSKIINSDIEGFKGRVTFHSPLNLEQVFCFEDAKDSSAELEPSAFLKRLNEVTGEESVSISWSSRADKFIIPALLKCIEKFECENMAEIMTLENFPLTPRHQTQAFIDFLWNELHKIYLGETEIPNES